jgi:pimeloyl-ACP methyl ester carboxylesterase
MTFQAAITTLRLLHAVQSHPLGQLPNVLESEVELADGAGQASLFEPRRCPQRTIVLVHGVTGRANADPLLVQLARALSALGTRCVVPAVRHLSQFRHDARDIQTVAAAIMLAHELQHGRVGVFGFSYGASYALCAAGVPQARYACSALVGFGAYYDLAEALEHQRQQLLASPDLERDDADIAYLRYTLLACHREELGFCAEAWHEIDAILVNFTSPRPIEATRAPLLRYARGVDFVKLMESYQRRKVSPLLSPAANLSNLRCQVGLLHDPNDRFIPPSHAERIRQELAARECSAPVEVLTTPMLSHVHVSPMRRIFDLPRLFHLLEPVLTG